MRSFPHPIKSPHRQFHLRLLPRSFASYAFNFAPQLRAIAGE